MIRLSVVIIAVGDTIEPHCDIDELKGCLESLSTQYDPSSMEIIVPFHSGVHGIEELRGQFPRVNFLDVGELVFRNKNGWSREHHDELRTKATMVAQGEIISLLEDHVRPAEGWTECIVDMHQKYPYAAIGGAIENGIDQLLNWAVYFCDLGRYQNPLPFAESPFASVVNISYKRNALEKIRKSWSVLFNETLINNALLEQGEKIALSPDMVVYQYRLNLDFLTVLKEFFVWGRSFAQGRANSISTPTRMILSVGSVFIPLLMIFRMTRRIIQKQKYLPVFIKSFPIILLETISWSIGEFTGYLFSKSSELAHAS